jgi:hypothetical protein
MTTKFEMWNRIAQLTDRLTPDEKSSLEELNHGPMRASIPFQHAERLITLGLAELSSGRLDLTIAGKQLLAECQRRSKISPP